MSNQYVHIALGNDEISLTVGLTDKQKKHLSKHTGEAKRLGQFEFTQDEVKALDSIVNKALGIAKGVNN